jgi:hypothetical protein
MATVLTPLLSFGSSGAIGKQLVYGKRGDSTTVREYVRNADAQSPAQVARRALLAQGNDAWRKYFTDPRTREAWARSEKISKTPVSAYNLFVSSATRQLAISQAASGSTTVFVYRHTQTRWFMIDYATGAGPTDSASFALFEGEDPGHLLYVGESTMYFDRLIYSPSLPAGTVAYGQIRHDGINCSGIQQYTI